MTTSMQLAQECLKTEESVTAQAEAQPYEGLEVFAQTLEAGELLSIVVFCARIWNPGPGTVVKPKASYLIDKN